MTKIISVFVMCLILSCLSCNQKVDKSKTLPPVETKSSPKTVEDSAKHIIERANKNLKDSGKEHNGPSSVKPG